jgi:hypothetical protein
MVGVRARRGSFDLGSFSNSPNDGVSVSVLHSDTLPNGASSYSQRIAASPLPTAEVERVPRAGPQGPAPFFLPLFTGVPGSMEFSEVGLPLLWDSRKPTSNRQKISKVLYTAQIQRGFIQNSLSGAQIRGHRRRVTRLCRAYAWRRCVRELAIGAWRRVTILRSRAL